MRLHLPGGETLRGQRDHQLVDPGQPPLPLGDDLRLEGGVPVAGDVDLDRPDLGQHRLGSVPVAGVPAVAPGRVVAAVAQVVGELALERGLDQPLGQLREQPALAGQLQPAGTGTPGQLGDQLFVDSVQTRRVRGRGLTAGELVEVHQLLGHHVGHQVLSLIGVTPLFLQSLGRQRREGSARANGDRPDRGSRIGSQDAMKLLELRRMACA